MRITRQYSGSNNKCTIIPYDDGIEYRYRVWIYATCKDNQLFIWQTKVTDTEILEYYDGLMELANAINEKNEARVEIALKFLDGLRNLLDKKIEYALNQNYNCDYSKENFTRYHIKYKVEYVEERGRIFTIDGMRFPVVYYQLDDNSACSIVYNLYKKYLCEPRH